MEKEKKFHVVCAEGEGGITGVPYEDICGDCFTDVAIYIEESCDNKEEALQTAREESRYSAPPKQCMVFEGRLVEK